MMLILNKNYFTYAGFLDSLKMPDSKAITKIVWAFLAHHSCMG